MRALRERREWLDALEKAKGGVSNRALVGARAEAKAPFRLARLFTFGGLGAGAALGLAVIAGRLIAALKGVQSRPCTSFYMSCTVKDSLLYFFLRQPDSKFTYRVGIIISGSHSFSLLGLSPPAATPF